MISDLSVNSSDILDGIVWKAEHSQTGSHVLPLSLIQKTATDGDVAVILQIERDNQRSWIASTTSEEYLAAKGLIHVRVQFQILHSS